MGGDNGWILLSGFSWLLVPKLQLGNERTRGSSLASV